MPRLTSIVVPIQWMALHSEWCEEFMWIFVFGINRRSGKNKNELTEHVSRVTLTNTSKMHGSLLSRLCLSNTHYFYFIFFILFKYAYCFMFFVVWPSCTYTAFVFVAALLIYYLLHAVVFCCHHTFHWNCKYKHNLSLCWFLTLSLKSKLWFWRFISPTLWAFTLSPYSLLATAATCYLLQGNFNFGASRGSKLKENG